MAKTFQESLIQFIVAMIIGWLIMYLVPANTFYTIYLPISFFGLFYVMALGAIGRGWPVAPPEGIWKPGMSKSVPGICMTLLWIVLSIITMLVVTKGWPGTPLFPVTMNFGILLFMTTLWYALSWGAYPIAKKSGMVNLIGGAVIILVVTGIVWSILANFKDTAWVGAPFDPKGLFQVDFMFGLAIWIIAWIQIFGLSMQNYPFYKLGEPVGQIVLTIVVVLLGYFSWTTTLNFMSPSVSFAAVAGSIIGWTLFHSIIFGYHPNAKYAQPVRGIYNLIIVAVMTAIWIPLLRCILQPVLAKATAAGLPFDISSVGVFYTLHVVAILLLVHNFFWLKAPLTPPGPPLGPEEIPPVEAPGPEDDKTVIKG